MPTKLMTDAGFREAIKTGHAPTDALLRKGFECEIKAADDDSRTVDFTISTSSVDRMGDTIAVGGWHLDRYKKNPVVLWAHDSSMLPVGRAKDIRIDNGKLKATAEFMPKEISRFAEAVYQAVKGGFLSATSVGFQPIKYAWVENDPNRQSGIDFLEQELLEFSIVPIPANAEALIEARSMGLDIEPLTEWARNLIKKQIGEKLEFKAPEHDPEDCPMEDCPMKGKKSSKLAFLPDKPSPIARARAKAFLELARIRSA